MPAAVRTFLKNLLVAFLALVPPVIVDYLFVRSGQNHESIWYSSWANIVAYAFAPIGFYWANAKLFLNERKPWCHIYSAALAISLSAIWFFFIAIAVIINFHFAFGGRL